MANSVTSSAMVRGLATNGTSGTTAIHKEKFFVPISDNEHKDLFNFMRHVKTFTGLVEIAKP